MLEAGNIKTWIERISSPNTELGGFPVCPFAKNAEYSIIHTDGSDIDPPPWDFELIIYVLPESYTQQEVEDIATEYNKLSKEFVFLPDPKDRYTEISGVQTSNGNHNLILCQYRQKLNDARAKLKDTTYYDYWDKKYLEEILGT